MVSPNATSNASASLDDQLDIPLEATVKLPASFRVQLVASSTVVVPLTPDTCLRAYDGSGRGWLVGRQASTADVRIQHASVSRQHAVLYVLSSTEGHSLYLKDLGSKHGTTINQQRVQPNTTVRLQSGDIIQFGTAQPVFRVEIIDTTTSTEAADPSTAIDAVTAAESKSNAITEEDTNAPLRSDQTRLEKAGEGLTGRAKRQAEIEAMMESLEQTPTYHTTSATVEPETFDVRHSVDGNGSKEEEVVEEEEDDDAMLRNQLAQLARQYHVPLLQKLIIPSKLMRGSITCLAMDPSGARFVVGSTDTHLRYYDFGGMIRSKMESFRDIIPEDGHLLQDVAFSPSGDRVLVATSSVQPQIFDRDGHDILKFGRGDMYVTDPTKTIGHTAQVTSVDWHPLDRQTVLTGSLDGSARLWNLNGKTQFGMLVCDRVMAAKSSKGHRTSVISVTFHPGGRELAIGTSCGSIQIWNRSRASVTRPERAVYDAHGSGNPITSLVYTVDGTKLASRSANDDTIRIWNPVRLSKSSIPLFTCTGLETVHEHANASFNPDGGLLCAGQSALHHQGTERRETGALRIYHLPSSSDDNETATTSSATTEANVLCTIPMDHAPVLVQWHVKLNQIVAACADGNIVVYFDPKRSTKGALLIPTTSGRPTNVLSDLLRSKAASSIPNASQILTPFSMSKSELLESTSLERKRKRLERKDPMKSHEPERPASGKHKSGGQVGGMVTFQQFVADQRVSKSKAIAGKDPREALFQYTEGKSYMGSAYDGNAHQLAEKTAEQEEEDMKAKKS